MIALLRLLKGFVEFEATGGFPERFLNLCTINGITLWYVQNNGVKVKACTSINAYKNIRKSARKSGMKVKIVKKRGMPFFMKNNKSRVGLLIGGAFTIAVLAILTNMLWNIEVTGNEKIKTEQLIESLESHNVRIGVLKAQVDVIEVQKRLLDEYPELSWASINIFGTKAVLEVKENTKVAKIEDETIPMNIVAEKSGKIILVEGYRGVNAVKEGEVVLKGDLLISGVVKNQDESEKMVRASGKVFAQTKTAICGECEFLRDVNILSESQSKYYLYALGAEIPMFLKCKGETLYKGESLLESKSGKLPFGIIREALGQFNKEQISLTESQCEILSFFECVRKKRSCFEAEAEILSANYEKTKTDKASVTKCTVTAKEDIASEKQIFVD